MKDPNTPTSSQGSADSRSQPAGRGSKRRRSARSNPSANDSSPKDFWPTHTVKGNHNYKGVSPKARDGLETAVKRKEGLLPTPRSGKTTSEKLSSWMRRRNAGKVSTPPLGLAATMTSGESMDGC